MVIEGATFSSKEDLVSLTSLTEPFLVLQIEFSVEHRQEDVVVDYGWMGIA